jgi:hypothetical protein
MTNREISIKTTSAKNEDNYMPEVVREGLGCVQCVKSLAKDCGLQQ